jgi:hypothetical protein
MFMSKKSKLSVDASKCRKKFLKFFPGGFADETYLDWERNYKWNAHESWEKQLNKKRFRELLEANEFLAIAKIAVSIESKTNLLFSFEKMAIRDGVNNDKGAEIFASGLYNYLHGRGDMQQRFENFVDCISRLPRKQTRVLTWPVVTVFSFIADPVNHIFLKPTVTKTAAVKYGFDFKYSSKPNWSAYESLLSFAGKIRSDNSDLRPRDMIDLQSFIWVMGSDEY